MTIDQTKQEILKEFKEKFDCKDYPGELCELCSTDDAESFLSKSLDRMESECLKMKGQLKREWYQQGWKEAIDSLKKNHE